jgi:hypothetical protein
MFVSRELGETDEGWFWISSIYLYESSERGNRSEGFFTEYHERKVWNVSADGHLSS